MFSLRYTHDLRVIAQSVNPLDLADPARAVNRFGHVIHIIDMRTGKVIWQNYKSVRYGSQGVL